MNKFIKILLLSSFFSAFAGGLLGPIYAIFVTEIGGDVLTAGLTFASFSIASGVITFLLGKWEDNVLHKEKLLVVSRILSLVGYVGYFFVSNAWMLFAVQIIFGISSAIGMPAFDTLFSVNLDKDKATSEWGVWEAMYSIVGGISAILGSLVVLNFGFNILFIIMSILSTLALLITLLLFENIRLHLLKNQNS